MSITDKMKKSGAQIYQLFLNKHESTIIKSVLEKEDFLPCKNERKEKIQTIGFIVRDIQPHSGGHTSILRLGTGLYKQGFQVFFISFADQKVSEMKKLAMENYQETTGEFLTLSQALKMKLDLVMATCWQSVYYARRFDSYKMYFVQDYEPYFFKLNERYLLAKKTYELGLHIVSLGTWNLKQIQEHCSLAEHTNLDFIDFPYEPGEYKIELKRDYNKYGQKNKYRIAIYSKEDGKRIPNLLQIILERASEELKRKGIYLDIQFFGFQKSTKVLIGKNLGILTKNEMADIYRKADFGMVASMTNISLVPYEMLATGLPIIEFREGSFPYFLGEDSALLVDFNYKTLVNGFLEIRRNPEIVADRMKNALERMCNLTWETSCRQCGNIIRNITDKEKNDGSFDFSYSSNL